MVMRKFGIFVCILLISGCATAAGSKAVMDANLDKPESSLIQAWGAPSSVYKSGGLKYLT